MSTHAASKARAMDGKCFLIDSPTPRLAFPSQFKLFLSLQSDWRIVSGISAVFCVFTLLLVYFIPESPTWLIARGRSDEARKALAHIRAIKSNGTIESCFSYFPINFHPNGRLSARSNPPLYRIILERLIKRRNGAAPRSNHITKRLDCC